MGDDIGFRTYNGDCQGKLDLRKVDEGVDDPGW